MQITTANHTLDLSTPRVMTIINVTPDSFYEGSRTLTAQGVRERIARAVEEGASILDVGGYSSRPGADEVTPEEEIRRLSVAMEVIRADFPEVMVSLDTFRSGVARAIMERYGACIINDITGTEADEALIEVAARFSAPYIVMHMRGTPQTMQQLTHYDDLYGQVRAFFVQKIELLRSRGVEQVVLDPGFGFAKSTEQNYELLARMGEFAELGAPLLAGISRKSMIYKPLCITPEEALNGTTALHWECLRQGASLLRVHDTKQAVEVVRLFLLSSQANPSRRSL